jgi:hypothetical protein
MGNLYSAWPDGTDEEDKNSSNRLLKKLKVALLIWLISFIAAIIWFSFAG